MKYPLLASLLLAVSAATCHAGAVNIVNLGSDDPIELFLKTDGQKTSFKLDHGMDSGYFLLFDKGDTVDVAQDYIPDLNFPATKSRTIAILHKQEEAFKWKLVAHDAKGDEWSFRIVNLTGKDVPVTREGNVSIHVSDSVTEIPVKGNKDLRVKIAEVLDERYEGKEPISVTAVLYLEDEKIKVIYISG